MAKFMKCPHCGEQAVFVPQSTFRVNSFEAPANGREGSVESVPKASQCPACKGWAQVYSTYRVSHRTTECKPLEGQEAETMDQKQERLAASLRGGEHFMDH